MTLADLTTKVRSIGDMFNSWSIPMKKNGEDYNIKLAVEKDNNGEWFIDVKED